MPKLAFHPARDGWHFQNNFVNVVLPGTPTRFETGGLCGGMVMTALDYWRAGVPIPTHAPLDFGGTSDTDFGVNRLPADGSRLRTYIYDRQMNSLLTGLTFSRWVVAPWFGPNDFHSWAIGSEFDVVRRQIDRGRPAMLGLWSMEPGNLAHGHQVLCYGYETTPQRLLWVYDPNHPNEEAQLIPVSPQVGIQLCDAKNGGIVNTYRGYFWTDVYNWNEPPYEPHYRDLEIADGLTLSPNGNNVPVGGRMDCSVTIRNAGEYATRFQNLFIWTRGPGGSNLDALLGGAEPGLTILHPGEQRTLNRSSQRFGNDPGTYVVGVSYLSNQNYWHNITRGLPNTRGQQAVTLQRRDRVMVDKTVTVAESQRDVDTGIDVAPGQEFALTAWGSIWAGVWLTGQNGPEGWTNRIETNPQFPYHSQPQAHPFSLIGRFDGMPYFYVGRDTGQRRPYPYGSARRLWLRINDNTPGNGSGAFQCRIQVWG